MSVTDEMIEVTREAIYRPWMDADKATMRRISKDALIAIYPLIKAQVLEEAAKAIAGFKAAREITPEMIERGAGGVRALYTNKPKGWRPSPTKSAKACLLAALGGDDE